MSTLVVQSHPVEASFSATILQAVCKLEPDAIVVRLGQGDRLTAYTCIDVTRLVVIYPTWWGSLPAELLHAMNDLIGPWVDGVEVRATSPLRSVESITVLTSHGSPKLLNKLQGEAGRHFWKRTVVPLCRPGARFGWQSMYNMDQASATDRGEFLRSVTFD